MANNPRAVDNLIPLKKWETANPNGRPKKGIALCNAQLKEQWFEPATKADIEANYMSLLNVDEEILKEMAQDKKQPMLIRIIIKNMLWGKWFDIVEKMLDRWIWKAVQKEEINHAWNITIWNILKKVQWLDNDIV